MSLRRNVVELVLGLWSNYTGVGGDFTILISKSNAEFASVFILYW